MLKKVPCVTLIFSVFLFILLFTNVNFASAQSSEGTQDCANKQVPSTLEFLRLGLTPSLKDSDGGIPIPYSLIPNPLSMGSKSGQGDSSVASDAQLSAKRVGQRAMYRLYNQWTGEHFYTCSEEERDEIAKVGWTKEDIGWVSPKESSTPVYRLYNKYIPGGDHHYTPNADERDSLVKVGWIYEGIGWYSADEGSLFRAPVYRQYNPYADTGTHNYTLSTSEKDMLVKAGWRDEGVGYYGLDQSLMSAIDFDKDIKVTTTSKVYNGKAQTQSITSSNLKLNEDYIVEYANNKNVGTATITITGTNGFYGEKVYTFQITQKTISEVKWGDLEFGYDGKAHVPTATAVGLCSGDSATITVTASGNHKDTGTYTATATAISNKNYKLASNLKTDFRIGTKIDFDNKNKPTVDTADEVYTGSAITKEVSVAGLTKDQDYIVTYKDNINVGTATLTIKGIGEYFGEKSYTFKITQKSLAGATVTAETLTYNGSEQVAKISKVTLDGRNLKEGTDFKVVSGNKGKVANTYEGLTIEGIGNYKGQENNGSWTISPKTVGIDWSNTSITYDGTPKTPTATVTDVYGSDSVTATVVVTEENHTNTGTYHATATELDNANYQLPTPNPTTTFEVVAKEATEEETKDIKLELDGTDYVYDKTAKEPVVVGIPAKFVEDTDYSIEYSNNVNAGENTAKVTVKFKGNYAGEKVLMFSIDQKPVILTGATVEEKVYDGNNVATIETTDAKLSGVIDTDVVSFSTVTGEFDSKNQGENKDVAITSLTFSGSDPDKNNYKLSEDQPTLTGKISPKTVTISGLSAQERVFAEDDKSVNVVGTPAFATGDICEGDTVSVASYEAGEYASADAADGKEITLTFMLDGNDDGNYVISGDSKKITGNVLAIVKFDTNCHYPIPDKFVHIGVPFEDDFTSQLIDRPGLTKEGWYNNAACAVDDDASMNKWNFDTSAVNSNVTTLYINWTPTTDAEDGNQSYWIGPSYKVTTANTADEVNQGNNAADKEYARDSYVSEEWNVLKSSSEIEMDIISMTSEASNGSASDVDSVTNEYKAMMSSDKYHLYTKYNYEGDSKDGYAEFRIIEVGQHLNTSGDSNSKDGSIITFMAAHVLPERYEMNVDRTNYGGWANMPLHGMLQSGGEIFNKFNTAFTDKILRVPKLNNAGGGASATTMGTTTYDKFWLISNSELVNYNSWNTYWQQRYGLAMNEGNYYQWCKDKNIGLMTAATSPTVVYNYVFDLPTRAGVYPCEAAGIKGFWERTVSSYDQFCIAQKEVPYRSISANGSVPVCPCFAFGGQTTLTFDSNAPSGATATTDGENAKKSVLAEKDSILTSDLIPDDDGLTCTSSDGSTYVFAGWSENKNDSVTNSLTKSELEAESVLINDSKTYYAIWLKSDGFWLGTKGADATLFNEAQFAKHDVNYVSGANIKSDIDVMSNSANEDYSTVKGKWDDYYNNADSENAGERMQVRLYASYSGGQNEGSYGDGSIISETSELNKYVEFRILEVSGEEGHLNKSGDDLSSDGSVVSFMATHVLPTAYQMNTASSNAGGWESMSLRTNLNVTSAGNVFNKFNSIFTNSILPVKKLNDAGGGAASSSGNSVEDKFWLPSYSEMHATGTRYSYAPEGEGAAYKWFSDNSINGSSKNDVLSYTTRAGKTPGSSAGSECQYWQRSPQLGNANNSLSVSVDGSINNSNSATDYLGVAPCFALGKQISVKFDANAPSGTTATVDGSNSSVTVNVNSGTVLGTNKIPDDSKLTCTTSDGSTYVFAGWSEDKEDTVANSLSRGELASQNVVIDAEKTYYAIWLKTSGFWLGTKGADSSYFNEAQFAKHDVNYVSGTDIKNDMDVLNNSEHATYTNVKAKWDDYYNNADTENEGPRMQVRLYATYAGGESEQSYANSGASELNKYVEFRILEVSGAQGHKECATDAGSSDGSVVTFMATHVLPTAYQMNSSDDNTGGWGLMSLRTSLNVAGDSNIFSRFSTDFTGSILSVDNQNNAGGGAMADVEGTTTQDKFWLPSYSELYSKGTYYSSAPKNEGATYKWFEDKEIKGDAANSSLIYKTRAGKTPGSSTGADSVWWQRSPLANEADSSLTVDATGNMAGSGASGRYYGVLPCFSFGEQKPKATFDSNAPEGTTATVDGTNEKTSIRVSSGTPLTSDKIPSDGGLTCATSDGSTYVFAGWSENKDDTVVNSLTNSELAAKSVNVSANKTYYAIWLKSDGYWLGSKEADATMFNEAQFVKNDINYVSSADIMTDMEILQNSKNESYSTVKSKWDGFYENADSSSEGKGYKVRLYATYAGGETEASYASAGASGATSELNKYVEFRILEVSGVDGHLKEVGDDSTTDCSVVTFIATHALPTAYQMNATSDNTDGWSSSDLRSSLNTSGETNIFSKFNTNFTNDVFGVSKLNNAGGGSSVDQDGTSTTDKFWLPSYSELYAKEDYFDNAPKGEGTTYKWFSDCNIKGTSANDALKYATRAGETPGSTSDDVCCWWQRSPLSGSITNFLLNNENGQISDSDEAIGYNAVVPCFAFGKEKPTVTFDSNAPAGTSATADGLSEKKIQRITQGWTLSSDKIPEDTAPTCTATDGSVYMFAGWGESKDTKPKDALSNANLAAKAPTINEDKTYYAIWAKKLGFWLGTKSLSASTFSDESDFALTDVNYVSGEEILADKKILHDSSDANYSATWSKWKGFYDNAEGDSGTGYGVRLYATYSGGENEPSSDSGSASVENKYVEFRILEVSSFGGHDGDGSAVTFLATHTLPTGYQMNPAGGSVGGWSATTLRSELQEGGSIYAKFPTALTREIKEVKKLNNAGGGSSQSAAGTPTNDAFWLLSYSELYATGTYHANSPTGEGSAYEWCKDKNINGSNSNSVFYDYPKTRAGEKPGSLGAGQQVYERSPRVSITGVFQSIYYGYISVGCIANEFAGVMPAFCL